MNNPPINALQAVLDSMAQTPDGDPLNDLVLLTSALSSAGKERDSGTQAWDELIRLLEENDARRVALRARLASLFATRNTASFFASAGLLPNTGFFSELRRKLVHKLLPEVLDPNEMKDCVHLLFPQGQRVMADISPAQRTHFWSILGLEQESLESVREVLHPMLDAALEISHRVAAMGLEPELLRIRPRIREGLSPFVALNSELLKFVADFRLALTDFAAVTEDEKHILVLLEQCREEVLRARQAALKRGTSMSLSYLLLRLDQHLTRLELLLGVLSAYYDEDARTQLAGRWSALMMHAMDGERQRNSLGRHFSDLAGVMALRVTENAAHTGEHYIARDRSEWLGIWRAAAGAGVLIALLALLKLLGSGLHLALLNQALLNGAIYGLGFALVHVLHFIIATKQPAMTAAAIASTISQTQGRMRDIQRLTDLSIATLRSQLAAIVGNVMAALPVALLIGMLAGFSGIHLIGEEKAQHVLHEIDPIGSAALIFAAVAGVWLFLSGLVSGYFDNLAAYSNIGKRIASLGWLRRWTGETFAARVGAYVDHNLGGLSGNLFFGLMLGLTPAIGLAFGLPLDIRHVAFSSANFGYALTALDFDLSLGEVARSVTGIALIGMVNLVVSFSLALWVAMRARGADFKDAANLPPELWRQFRAQPGRFFWVGR